jgi:uncharacterized membrane protein (UPF0127 family)
MLLFKKEKLTLLTLEEETTAVPLDVIFIDADSKDSSLGNCII